MNSVDLLNVIGDARDDYIQVAGQCRNHENKSKRRMHVRSVWLAAVLTVLVLALVGCAVTMIFGLQDLKIGEYTTGYGEILDSDGNIVKETEIVKAVISLQGYGDSPSIQAAREWFEFEQSYEVVWDEEREKFEQERSDIYDAYGAYTQEMADKLDEIAAKYGLKLAGTEAVAQSYQSDIFFDALGLEKLHREGAQAEYLGGYFYECGNFNMDFFLTLPDGHWPHAVLANMRCNGKEYLDTVYASIPNIDEVEQWNYTTDGGTDILIVMGKDFARFFCDREDAFISVGFGIDYEHESGETEYMSKADVELVADALDFTVTPRKPDIAAVKQKLALSEAEKLAEQKEWEEFGYREFIVQRIEALEHPEELYYTLIDIDQNGVVDLLLGSKEQCDTIWTMAYDEMAGNTHMNLVSLTDELWADLDEAWPNMEIYPITTYPMED